MDFDDDFNSTNIFRGPPTAEREEAWYNMTFSKSSCPVSVPATPGKPNPLSEHAIEVPENEIAGLNRSEADHLRHVPEDVGTGYVGMLEVFHQLHCLVSKPLTDFPPFYTPARAHAQSHN